MKTFEGDSFFFLVVLKFKKSVTFLFIIVVEKSPNIKLQSYAISSKLAINLYPMSNRTRRIPSWPLRNLHCDVDVFAPPVTRSGQFKQVWAVEIINKRRLF